jgi:hypothetical protein
MSRLTKRVVPALLVFGLVSSYTTLVWSLTYLTAVFA